MSEVAPPLTTLRLSPDVTETERARWLRFGRLVMLLSLGWTIVEAVVGVWAGEASGSVALLGFGIDSIIETASAGVVLWRLLAESRPGANAARINAVEKTTGRWMAVILGALAAFLVVESVRRLMGFGREPGPSVVGLVLTALAGFLMFALFAAKRRIARAINSGAVRADSVQSLACFWLSVATFAGLGLNAWLGWSWADPAAGLVLVPLVLKEAVAAWKGDGCGCGGAPCGRIG
jgi:divalent metal cation (Fe/Co/Zn/Cd) transporter